MFKRNKGYFLLTMLVLTGLAGRMHTNILSTKERHTLVTELKTSRNDFFNSVDGLSTKQLNFKPNENELSVKECILKLVAVEKSLWTSVQVSLKQETSSAKKTIQQDEALPSLIQENAFTCQEVKFKTLKEAMKYYKNERAQILKYVHTSTQNVRGHIAATHFGNLDAYQLLLLTTIYAKHYTQQIEKIKAHPNFPK